MKKIEPLTKITLPEILDRYGISRSTLTRRIAIRKFPAPTGRNREGYFWDARVVEKYDEDVRKLAEKSFVAGLAPI